MLKSIFYARFHPERGPSVIHQHPIYSIIPSHESDSALVNWSNVTSYIIPPYDLCNHPLSICTEGYRVLGFPISIESPKYERNRFTFNVCFVLRSEVSTAAWDPLVRKTAHFFQTMELEDDLLSLEETLPNLKWAGSEEPHHPSISSSSSPEAIVGLIHPLLFKLFSDLNSYSEVSAFVTENHILNLRLSLQPCSTLTSKSDPPPLKIQPWHVPLFIRALPPPSTWTRDLTLRRIYPFIDGVNHVLRIAELADAELRLVRKAVRELVLAKRARLLDLFHFSAVYTPTDTFATFVASDELQRECAEYISHPANTTTTTIGSPEQQQQQQYQHPSTITSEDLINLYANLQPGLPLSAFAQANKSILDKSRIDLRRFVTFGILKGFLRRIHRYALSLDPPHPKPHLQPSSSPSSPTSTRSKSKSRSKSTVTVTVTGSDTGSGTVTGTVPTPAPAVTSSSFSSTDAAIRDFDRAWRKAALSSGWATPPSGPPPSASLGKGSAKSLDQMRSEEDEKLGGYLDGESCLDKICVEMGMTEREVVERVRKRGEVVVFSR